MPRPLTSTLFPYTTLFRSLRMLKILDCMRAFATISLASRLASVSARAEEHTSELQSHSDIVCRLLLEKKKIIDGHTGDSDDVHTDACFVVRPHAESERFVD